MIDGLLAIALMVGLGLAANAVDTFAVALRLIAVLVPLLYFVVAERYYQTTPGKRLLGCEVRLENFEKPNIVQIVIRNITKFVELMPYLQIWPFLLVVFFTRNHQRVGDLLAHTLVVEHHQVVSSGDFDDKS